MLRPAFLLFVTWAIIFAPSCSKNTTNPPPPDTRVDTTSHNFVWQIDTLGPRTTSLRSVAFISDTEAWAVGRISFSDSSGQGFSYGLAKWENSKWTFELIESEANNALLSINEVLVFNGNNIWLAAGSIYRWTGGPFADLSWLRNVSSPDIALSIWGNNPDNLYSVGSEGLMLRFNGSSWTELPRLTSMRLLDIAGDSDGDVWVTGNTLNGGQSILLHGTLNNWQIAWEQNRLASFPYEGELSSLWYAGNDSLVIVGGRQIYWQDIRGDSLPRKEAILLEAFPWKVRGQAHNDIFVVGQQGMVWHYNGQTWKSYTELQNDAHEFVSVAIRGDRVIIVGQDYSQGVQRLIIISGVREI